MSVISIVSSSIVLKVDDGNKKFTATIEWMPEHKMYYWLVDKPGRSVTLPSYPMPLCGKDEDPQVVAKEIIEKYIQPHNFFTRRKV